jgi:hypothetical protein
MASENALIETEEDNGDVGGSYVLSTHVSSHPAFLAPDGVNSVNIYTNGLGTSPSTTTDVTLTYFWGTTDITSTVDTYLLIVAGSSPCQSPATIPTTLSIVGTGCYSFQKQPAYINDHTFKIQVSGSGSTNAPYSNLF